MDDIIVIILFDNITHLLDNITEHKANIREYFADSALTDFCPCRQMQISHHSANTSDICCLEGLTMPLTKSR